MLPNVEAAVLDIRKIEEYCLSPTHPRGRHKARVFRNALGIGRTEAVWLRTAILEGVRETTAARLEEDRLGARWRVDIKLTRHGQTAVIRTIWIVRTGEQAPRFVTCWVL
jgi:hypothetical protein